MKTDKILSLIMAVLIPFPLLITGLSSTYQKIPHWAVVLCLLCGAVSWALGHLVGRLMTRVKGRGVYFARLTLVIVGIIITVFCEIIIFTVRMGIFAPMFIPLSLIFWYWFGFRAGSRQSTVPNMIIGAYAVETVFMYPICAAFNENSALAILILTAFLTVLGALLINFRQVSGSAMRGKSENRLLTKACARFNVKTTLIFCGIVLFAFFFAGYGAKWLSDTLKAVIRFIIYIMGLLAMQGDGEYDPGGDADSSVIQVEPNSWGRYLIWIAVIVLAVIFFKPFIKLLKNLYRYIMGKLGKTPEEESESEYVDIYQSTDIRQPLKNTFKKAFKKFLREKELKKKYRLGYKAFMLGLEEHGAELAPGDTADEHCKKGRELLQSEALYAIADKYSEVRYDEQTPSKEDCDIMKGLLKEISGTKIPKGEKL